MALTFLNVVNAVLKPAGMIHGIQGELTTFTDEGRQTDIDVLIQSWNEVIAYLYRFGRDRPQEVDTDSITLSTNTREYSLASDFEGFTHADDEEIGPTQTTDGYRLYPYPGGFNQMVKDQLQPANYTGRPLYYVINPTNRMLRLDTAPTTAENGEVYTYYYTKRIALSATTDTLPFSDTVAEHLYPAVTEWWSRKRKEKFDAGIFNASIALAIGALNDHEQSSTY